MMIETAPSIYVDFAPNVDWGKHKSNYTLHPVEIHVWKIEVPEHFCNLFKNYCSVLDQHEFDRAKRFYWEKGFRSFLTGRIILRILLGQYLSESAVDIKFDLETKKPAVIAKENIKFNLSYSGEYILISIALCETGIDIEKINTNLDYESVLSSCFSEKERMSIKKNDSRYNFFLQWTRKEAILKYTGQGIIDDLSTVPCLDGKNKIQNKKINLTEDVNLTSFLIAHDCTGSLVYPRQITDIKYFEWK